MSIAVDVSDTRLCPRIAGNRPPRTMTRSKSPGITADAGVSVPPNPEGTNSYARRPSSASPVKTKILPLTVAIASESAVLAVWTVALSFGMPVLGSIVEMRSVRPVAAASR